MQMMTRLLLVFMLTLGLIAPRLTAVVAQLMPGSFETIVICTGDSLQTITLDANGTPIETQTSDSHPCTLATALTPAAPPALPTPWVLAPRGLQTAQASQIARPSADRLRPPAQGPPQIG